MNPRVPLSCALALAVLGCAGLGGTRDPGYTIDSGASVVQSGYNLCWRTSYWTPALADADCDPDLVPKPKPKPDAAAVPPAATPAAPAARSTPTPSTTAPAPKPAPSTPATAAVVPPAPKRCDATVSLQSDETFAFNSAALTSTVRARIDADVLARVQQCASIDAILVTGHTDRIGSQPYNQRLSQQRAQAVKDYLASKGVQAAKIEASGRGKTAPVKFCPDSRNQKALIACLAPNRRVDVEIKGPGR